MQPHGCYHGNLNGPRRLATAVGVIGIVGIVDPSGSEGRGRGEKGEGEGGGSGRWKGGRREGGRNIILCYVHKTTVSHLKNT